MTKADVPKIFRIILQVPDLERAAHFYSALLGVPGRRIRWARHYFDCGAVILALLDPSEDAKQPKSAPDCTYFSVLDLDAVHARAKELSCLSQNDVHGAPGGAIKKRPWGERSFYVIDPFGNELCFVEADTIFTGK